VLAVKAGQDLVGALAAFNHEVVGLLDERQAYFGLAAGGAWRDYIHYNFFLLFIYKKNVYFTPN